MSTDWLRRFVSEDSGVRLWDAVHAAHGVRFVSDGRCLLAVDDPAATFSEPDVFAGKDARERNTILSGMLTEPPPDESEPGDLVDLWAWLDRLDRVPCLDCAGYGRYAWYAEGDGGGPVCVECDGRGWYWTLHEPDDPANTVELLGRPFDRNRLAWWLPGELADVCGEYTECRLWEAKYPKMTAVNVAGRGWRLVATAVKREQNPRQYRAYTLGAGLWWSHRRDETARLVAEDWAQERGMKRGVLFGATV